MHAGSTMHINQIQSSVGYIQTDVAGHLVHRNRTVMIKAVSNAADVSVDVSLDHRYRRNISMVLISLPTIQSRAAYEVNVGGVQSPCGPACRTSVGNYLTSCGELSSKSRQLRAVTFLTSSLRHERVFTLFLLNLQHTVPPHLQTSVSTGATRSVVTAVGWSVDFIDIFFREHYPSAVHRRCLVDNIHIGVAPGDSTELLPSSN